VTEDGRQGSPKIALHRFSLVSIGYRLGDYIKNSSKAQKTNQESDEELIFSSTPCLKDIHQYKHG
jgi:hypothetical protein